MIIVVILVIQDYLHILVFPYIGLPTILKPTNIYMLVITSAN